MAGFPAAPLESLFSLPPAEDAEHRPVSGRAPYGLRVLHGRGVDAYAFGESSFAASGNVLHILDNALRYGPPAEGDKFHLIERDVTLVVQGALQRGMRGLVWELDTYEE